MISQQLRGRTVTVNYEADFGTIDEARPALSCSSAVAPSTRNSTLGLAQLDGSFPKTANQHRLFRYAERDAKDAQAGLG